MKEILILSLVVYCMLPAMTFAKDCNVVADFKGSVKESKQNTKVSSKVYLLTKQYLSYQIEQHARMATNITCQVLTGTKYSDSEQEWQNILKENFSDLSKQGYSEVKLTPLLAEQGHFSGTESHREYRMDVQAKKGTQVFYSLNLLNPKKDSLYSIMVSGDNSIEKEILAEYKRIVKSFRYVESNFKVTAK